jgi:asparagine synthase (glutamine-hydrolysing)
MCGIAGAIGIHDRRVVEAMLECIAHRGPDGEGLWASPGGGTSALLGSRRLAILDLSAAASMPMASKDGRYVITYNGEVFNFREVRAELERLGHHFETTGDTEVILAAYQQWGTDSLSHLNGMFAVAIWDCRDSRLFLARDRMGVKPLYYTELDGGLAFGSEIKSLVVPGLRSAKINMAMLPGYLRYQFVAWPDTLFEGVFKLPPAHFAIFENGSLSITRYWRPDSRKGQPAISDDELQALIEDAVRLRLVSDVPVGVFLSGGVDSSIISALASQRLESLVSYTVRYDVGEARYDEGSAARVTADFLKIENREVICSVRDALDKIPSLIWHLDEPVADTLIYPFFALSQAARNTFTVALSGEGSDELFFGYRYYTLERIRRVVAPFVPNVLRAFLRRHIANADLSIDMRKRALATITSATAQEGFDAWAGATFSPAEIAELLGRNEATTGAGAPSLERLPDAKEPDSRSWAPYIDMHFRLVDFILAVRDKMSMAASLELRTPFLDYRIVEAAMNIPTARKLGTNKTKRLVHRIAGKLVPHAIASRRKVPFSAPIHYWLEPLAREYLANSELARDEVLSPKALAKWAAFDAGRSQHPYKLWSLLMLEIWYRLFVTKSVIPQRFPLPASVQRPASANARVAA